MTRARFDKLSQTQATAAAKAMFGRAFYARRCSGRAVVRCEKADGRAMWFEEVGEGATWTEAFEDARTRLTRAPARSARASR
jgi:hypothetical protein